MSLIAKIHAREILELKDRLNNIYVKHTGQTLKKVEAALERGGPDNVTAVIVEVRESLDDDGPAEAHAPRRGGAGLSPDG